MSAGKIDTLIVIPARGGSKGVPRKNIRIVHGRPLIEYAIQTALSTRNADHVVVSTEDEEIASISRKIGIEVIQRPAEFAEDHVNLTAVIRHARTVFEARGIRLKRLVSLQPTSPLITPASVSDAIQLHVDTDCDSVVSITRVIHGHPYWTKSFDPETNAINYFLDIDMDQYTQKQDLPLCFTYTGGIYIRNAELLKNGNGFCLGNDIRGYLVSAEEAIDIEVEEDLRYFEFLLKEKKYKNI